LARATGYVCDCEEFFGPVCIAEYNNRCLEGPRDLRTRGDSTEVS